MVSLHGGKGHQRDMNLKNMNNRSQKLKQNDPISIPHDGNIYIEIVIPLIAGLQNQGDEQQKQYDVVEGSREELLLFDDDSTTTSTIIRKTDLLNRIFHNFMNVRNNKDNSNTNNTDQIVEMIISNEKEEIIIVKDDNYCFEYQLLQNMINSITMKEQLQALQNYRNKIDHKERQQQQQQQRLSHNNNSNIDPYHDQQIFVFTILFELYLSINTSTIIKRSLRSSYLNYNIIIQEWNQKNNNNKKSCNINNPNDDDQSSIISIDEENILNDVNDNNNKKQIYTGIVLNILNSIIHCNNNDDRINDNNTDQIDDDNLLTSISNVHIIDNNNIPSTVRSYMIPKNNWYDPLYTLQEVLDCDFIIDMFYTSNIYHHDLLCRSIQLLYYYTQYISTTNHGEIFTSSSSSSSTSLSLVVLINQSIQIATILNKLLLIEIEYNTNNHNHFDDDLIIKFEQYEKKISFYISHLYTFFWKLFTYCSYIPTDNSSILGITFGRILQYQNKLNSDNVNETVDIILKQCNNNHISELYKSTIIQGLLATISNNSIIETLSIIIIIDNNNNNNNTNTALHRLFNECKSLAILSTCPDVRLHATKSLRALISKIQTSYEEYYQRTIMTSTNTKEGDNNIKVFDIFNTLNHNIYNIIKDTLHIVLIVWDNPPTKKLANAIPGLFDSLIRLLMKVNNDHHDGNDDSSITNNNNNVILNELLQHILNKPLNRKCRYLALETLLPITGANRILLYGNSDDGGRNNIIVSSSSSSNNIILKKNQSITIVDDLIHGIGDRGGYNTGVISDLWAKLLKQSLLETKKHQQQSQSLSLKETAVTDDMMTNNCHNNNDRRSLPFIWFDLWIPSLAKALIQQEPVRRKQVASFCLSRLDTIIQSDRNDLIECYDHLLRQIRQQQQQLVDTNDVSQPNVTQSRETLHDRVFWAEMEVIRSAGLAGLLKKPEVIRNADGLAGILKKPLSSCGDDSTIIKFQNLVKDIMPLDRLRYGTTHFLPIINIVAFQIINYIVVINDGSYDDSDGDISEVIAMKTIMIEISIWNTSLPYVIKVDSKEYVSSILYCLLLLLDRLSATEGALLTKLEDQAVHNKERLPVLYSFIVEFLLHDIIISKLGYPGTVALKENFMIALLECIVVFVDRNHSLAVESKQIPKSCIVFHRKRLQVEDDTICDIRSAMITREVFASLFVLLHSTWDNTRIEGYRMLLNLYQMSKTYSISLPEEYSSEASRDSFEARGIFLASSPRQREADTGSRILAYCCISLTNLSEKISFLERMVKITKDRICIIRSILESLFLASIQTQQEFPLCHGIIQCIKLILQNDDIIRRVDDNHNQSLFEHISSCFYDYICVSLSIVADLKDGEVLEGIDEQLVLNCVTKRNDVINPGAIGANGLFSSVTRLTENEKLKRLASQRMVVGSWLSTKHACSAWAALLTTTSFFDGKGKLYKDAGEVLISTLTSLKHAGAAFAAHESLQQITMACFGTSNIDSVRELPRQWASRLLREVSENDKVKDATLRRSTGYALGFLSILRSEIVMVTSSAQRVICQHCIISLIRMSLPPKTSFKELMTLLQFNENDSQLLLSYNSESDPISLVSDVEYSVESRVHSLNILRLMLLDAPLAREMLPFVGIAFVSASLGYTNDAWNVRNSSTMVFAAAMLRSVDPDKNASNADETSSRAVAISEFFRLYPRLPRFFLAMLRDGVDRIIGSYSCKSCPAILPILLLFARVQQSPGHDVFEDCEHFISAFMHCLNHPDIRVRAAAARSLRNMTTGDRSSHSSAVYVLSRSEKNLLYCGQSIRTGERNVHWNHYHGTLLAIKELLSESNTLLERNGILHNEIRNITDLSSLGRWVPPTCISVALQILETIHESDLANRCDIISNWLPKFGTLSDLIPLYADLRSVSASIRMKIACNTIWNDVSSTNELADSFESIRTMLSSDCYDVKIKALKLFKKSLYDGLDSLSTSPTSDQKLDTICEILCVALCIEFDVESRCVLSFHRPSLRRMLRCLLECIQAKLRITQNTDESIFDARIIDYSLSLVSSRETLSSNGNHSLLALLHGNVLEFLAFALGRTNSLVSRENRYYIGLLISRYSHPAVDWRLRHSAAVALSSSKILSRDSLQDLTVETQDISFCLAMLLEWSELMQDSDLDVRIQASSILTGATQDAKCYNSELSIKNGFNMLCSYLPKIDLMQALFRKLDLLTCDIHGKLIRFQNDLPKKAPTTNEAGKLKIDRMIFEEEDPNSFKERCLLGQLAVREILMNCNQSLETSFAENENCEVLTNRCGKVLPLMCDYMNTDNAFFVENYSRNNLVFSDLHNLLLGTCCSVLRTRSQSPVLANVSSFRSPLEHLITSENNLIHPSILNALQALSLATNGDNESAMDAAMLSCFLIR